MAGVKTMALIDGGSDITCIDHELISQLDPTKCQGRVDNPNEAGVVDIQGRPLQISGTYLVRIEGPEEMDVWFPIQAVKSLGEQVILGWDLQLHLGFITDAAAATLTIAFPKGQVRASPDKLRLAAAAHNRKRRAGAWSTTVTPTTSSSAGHIKAHHKRQIRCKINLEKDLAPGTQVLIEQMDDGSGTKVVTNPALMISGKNNEIRVPIENHEFYDIFISKNEDLRNIRVSSTEGLAMAPAEPEIVASLTQATHSRPMTVPKPGIATLTKEKRNYLEENLDLSGLSPEMAGKYREWAMDNHDIFSGSPTDIGLAKGFAHVIKTTNDRPVYQKQFRVPHNHEAFLEEFCDTALVSDLIEECTSKHNSSIFVVPKEGGGLRIVEDLRGPNEVSESDQFAIADIKSIIDKVGRAAPKRFSALDLTSAFWQLALEENSRDLTAFTLYSRNTQFRWKRTCMGLKGAPSSFSRMMGIIFKGQRSISTYVDDALCYTRNDQEMLEVLSEVATRLRTYNLKLNPKKTLLGREEVKYLGFQLDKRGIRPPESKVKAVKDMKDPPHPKAVKEFLGLGNHFQKMIPNYSRVAGPLMDLTKKASTWNGGPLPPKAKESFEAIKEHLCSEPLLAFPDPSRPYRLSVDAAAGDEDNPGGLAAMLTQFQTDEKGQEVEKVISYWSRRLRGNEPNAAAYTLETKAIVEALEHFHAYCCANHTQVFSDHKPIEGASRKSQQAMTKLCELQNTYDITITYRKGVDNKPADCLSRQTTAAARAQRPDELPSMEEKDLASKQEKDPLVKAIRAFLSSGKVDKKDSGIIRAIGPHCFEADGLLWYLDTKMGKRPKARVITPRSMVPRVLYMNHGVPHAGHWGVARTTQRIAECHFWPTLAADVAAWCLACKACNEAKRSTNQEQLRPWPQATEFGERVHIDLIGPLKSDTRNKWILTCIDAFTKWLEVIPMTSKEADETARAFYDQWICNHGMCKQMISDKGKEFVNQVLNELCNLLKIDHHSVSALHPQANGQVERVNAEIKAYITAFTETTTDWEAWLAPCKIAHNTSICRSTGETPFFLARNRQARFPGDVTKPRIIYAQNTATELTSRLLEAREMAMARNEEAREKYKADHDKKARSLHVEPGDQCVVYFQTPPGVNPKFFKNFRSGFVLEKVLDYDNLVLLDINKNKSITVHKDRVKVVHQLPPELLHNSQGQTNKSAASNNKDPTKSRKGNNNINKDPTQTSLNSKGIYNGPITRSRAQAQESVAGQQPSTQQRKGMVTCDKYTVDLIPKDDSDIHPTFFSFSLFQDAPFPSQQRQEDVLHIHPGTESQGSTRGNQEDHPQDDKGGTGTGKEEDGASEGEDELSGVSMLWEDEATDFNLPQFKCYRDPDRHPDHDGPGHEHGNDRAQGIREQDEGRDSHHQRTPDIDLTGDQGRDATIGGATSHGRSPEGKKDGRGRSPEGRKSKEDGGDRGHHGEEAGRIPEATFYTSSKDTQPTEDNDTSKTSKPTTEGGDADTTPAGSSPQPNTPVRKVVDGREDVDANEATFIEKEGGVGNRGIKRVRSEQQHPDFKHNTPGLRRPGAPANPSKKQHGENLVGNIAEDIAKGFETGSRPRTRARGPPEVPRELPKRY